MADKAFWAVVSAVSVSLAGNVHADSFSEGAILTSSTLAATITHASLNIQPMAQLTSGGNVVTGATATGAGGLFGIFALNQNTGAGANVQQAVTVRVGDITVNAPH